MVCSPTPILVMVILVTTILVGGYFGYPNGRGTPSGFQAPRCLATGHQPQSTRATGMQKTQLQVTGQMLSPRLGVGAKNG